MRTKRSTSGELVNYKGLTIRSGTMDEYVPGQLNQYKALDMVGKHVIDFGAHIGGFTKFAHAHGAEHCLAVEPVPDNIRLWHINAAATNSELLDCAVVAEKSLGGYLYNKIKLYMSSSDTTGHTIDETRGRSFIEVTAVSVEYVLQRSVSASVAKIDIEGAEYDIMYDVAKLFPMFGITQFAAELHLNRKNQRQKAHEFVELFDKYYEQQVPVKIDGKLWNTTGVWRLR